MVLDDAIAAMARAPLLEHLDPEALRLLAFAAETRTLRPGQVLFREGEAAEAGCLVVRGRLVLEGAGAPVTAGPGDLVGRTALFTSTTRPATATAQGAATVLVIPHPLMRRVLEEFPQAAAAIQEALAADLDALSAELAGIEGRFRPGA